jgi:hypothetical protein
LSLVPIIAVFTKYDKVMAWKDRTFDESRATDEDERELLIKQDADAAVQELCTAPLEAYVGTAVPHMTISSTYFARNSPLIWLLIKTVF